VTSVSRHSNRQEARMHRIGWTHLRRGADASLTDSRAGVNVGS